MWESMCIDVEKLQVLKINWRNSIHKLFIQPFFIFFTHFHLSLQNLSLSAITEQIFLVSLLEHTPKNSVS